MKILVLAYNNNKKRLWMKLAILGISECVFGGFVTSILQSSFRVFFVNLSSVMFPKTGSIKI